MPAKQTYEYAVIRYVPRVELEEFVNVGVILFSKQLRFLKVRYAVQTERLKAFDPDVDLDALSSYLRVWTVIAADNQEGGRIGCLDRAERFRWLAATRSTVLQCSKIHPGLTNDPAAELDRLFAHYVR